MMFFLLSSDLIDALNLLLHVEQISLLLFLLEDVLP
jgi:hypothetical protein